MIELTEEKLINNVLCVFYTGEGAPPEGTWIQRTQENLSLMLTTERKEHTDEIQCKDATIRAMSKRIQCLEREVLERGGAL